MLKKNNLIKILSLLLSYLYLNINAGDTSDNDEGIENINHHSQEYIPDKQMLIVNNRKIHPKTEYKGHQEQIVTHLIFAIPLTLKQFKIILNNVGSNLKYLMILFTTKNDKYLIQLNEMIITTCPQLEYINYYDAPTLTKLLDKCKHFKKITTNTTNFIQLIPLLNNIECIELYEDEQLNNSLLEKFKSNVLKTLALQLQYPSDETMMKNIVANYPNLINLHMFLVPDQMQYLLKLKQLSILSTYGTNCIHIENSKITDDHLKFLPQSIQELSVGSNYLTNEALKIIAIQCPNLTELNICSEQINSFDDKDFSNLKKLGIESNDIINITVSNQKLTYLYLALDKKMIISENTIRNINNLQQLETLMITNYEFTEELFLKLNNNTNLTYLIMRNADNNITDNVLEHFVKIYPNLQYLDFDMTSRNNKYTINGLLKLQKLSKFIQLILAHDNIAEKDYRSLCKYFNVIHPIYVN